MLTPTGRNLPISRRDSRSFTIGGGRCFPAILRAAGALVGPRLDTRAAQASGCRAAPCPAAEDMGSCPLALQQRDGKIEGEGELWAGGGGAAHT